jgi:hypothetical protein
MSAEARALLGKHGLKPAVDARSIDLGEFDLRSREDVDNLGAAAYEEAQRLGYPGRLHYAWQAALARDLDNQLPSLEYSNGGIAKSIEDQARDLSFAQQDSARYFVRQHAHPLIAQGEYLGRSLVDWPVDQLRDALSAAMVDASPSAQRTFSSYLSAIEDSPVTSFHSVSYESTEVDNTVWVNTDNEDAANDPYTAWRNQGNVDGKGLDGLHIKPSVVANDPVWSGITNFAGGGMTYETSSDWHLQQSIAAQQSGGDGMNQGDDSNVF